MGVRADFRREPVVRLGAIDDPEAEPAGQCAEIGDMLIGREPRGEGFTNKPDQRADAQRQKRPHLFGDA